MLTAEARIETERPRRYLTQFCKHAASIGGGRHRPRLHPGNKLARGEIQVHADWTDTQATVAFAPWGQCTITADTSRLTVRIQATDEESLRRIQDIVTTDLHRFGRRDHLTVTWHRPDER